MLDAVLPPFEHLSPGLHVNPTKEETDLTETDPKTRETVTFPVFIRRARSESQRFVFAEVHWADLTRAGPDTHHFVLSLLAFVYGLRHIALQAALIPGKLAALLTGALRFAVFLLLGPVFALFLFEAVLYSIYLLFIPKAWDDLSSSRVMPLGCQAVLAIATIFLAFVRRRFSESIIWPSLMTVGAVTLLHLLLRAVGIADTWYATALIPRLNVPAETTPGEWPLTGFMIDYVLDRLLGLVSSALIVAAIAVALARIRPNRPLFRSMWTAWLATVLLVIMWQIAVMPIDLVAQLAYDKSRGASDALYTVWFNEGCLAGLAAAFLAAAVAAVTMQIRWAKRNSQRVATLFDVQLQQQSPNKGEPLIGPPRLIVAFPIQFCLLVFALVLTPLGVIDGFQIWEQRWGGIKYGWVYLVYIVAVFAILGWSLVFRNVLHILHDIVVHFASPAADRLRLRSRYTILRYYLRRRIANRFRAVVKLVLSERPSHLIVLAHSQGTIVAIEELRKPRWNRAFAELSSVSLVTFGSPLTHLYQHYFPFLYGEVTQGRWKGLRNHVDTWVNVFRIDDYVGTYIESPIAEWPYNIALPPGLRLLGHTRYWETDVFRAIAELLPQQPFCQSDRSRSRSSGLTNGSTGAGN